MKANFSNQTHLREVWGREKEVPQQIHFDDREEKSILLLAWPDGYWVRISFNIVLFSTSQGVGIATQNSA